MDKKREELRHIKVLEMKQKIIINIIEDQKIGIKIHKKYM